MYTCYLYVLDWGSLQKAAWTQPMRLFKLHVILMTRSIIWKFQNSWPYPPRLGKENSGFQNNSGIYTDIERRKPPQVSKTNQPLGSFWHWSQLGCLLSSLTYLDKLLWRTGCKAGEGAQSRTTRGLKAKSKDTQSPCNGSGFTSVDRERTETLLTPPSAASSGGATSNKGDRRDTRRMGVFYPKVSDVREGRYFLQFL